MVYVYQVLFVALVALSCVTAHGNHPEDDLFESKFSRHLLAKQYYCDKSVFGSVLTGGKIISTKVFKDAPLSTLMALCCDACSKAADKKCRHFSIKPLGNDQYECSLRNADAKVKKCGTACGNVGTSFDYFTSSITISLCSTNPGTPTPTDTYTYEGRKGPVFKGVKITNYPSFKTIPAVLGADACWRECVFNYNKGGYNPVDRCRAFNYNSNFKDCFLLSVDAAKFTKEVKYCKDPAFSAGYHATA